MTLTDLIIGLTIITFFIIGFSDVAFPALRAWEEVIGEYRLARSMEFVASSFRKECSSENRDIEKWKKAMLIVKELISYEISEIKNENAIQALKLSCIIGTEHIVIIGGCIP
jgi:hypothetical protein